MDTSGAPGSRALSRDEIRDIAYGFQKSRILLTAFELGLFTALGDAPRTSAEIAAALNTDPRATDRLMNALCVMGLLTKENSLFANTPSSKQSLVRGGKAFLAGLMHTVHLWDTWSTLTGSVRTGSSFANREVNDRGSQWLEAFIAAMHDRASRQAPSIVAQLDLSHVERVLDVGGGSGAFAVAFARANPAIVATVFDLPNVLPLTEAYVVREGLAGRVRTVAGDYLMEELGSGYDLVLLSAIVHSNSARQNRQLVRKCARALRGGGACVILDFIMDDLRVAPEQGAYFALNMLVGTEAGDTFTESEISGWMAEAGLRDVVRRDTPFGTAQIIGRKP